MPAPARSGASAASSKGRFDCHRLVTALFLTAFALGLVYNTASLRQPIQQRPAAITPP